MPYLCDYRFCDNKEIEEGKAVGCSKCEKPFHAECFKRHNQEKHSDRAIAKPLEEIKFPKPQKL